MRYTTCFGADVASKLDSLLAHFVNSSPNASRISSSGCSRNSASREEN